METSAATAAASSSPTRARRFRAPADVRWFLVAVRRAWLVRRRLDLPLRETIETLAALGPAKPPSPDVAWIAAVRAAGRVKRLAGAPDTCLVRALIAGSLLAARGDVRLHLGYRPGQPDRPVDGHAWLAGADFELGRDSAAGPPHEPALTLPFPAPRRHA
jgi:hypothetical protein